MSLTWEEDNYGRGANLIIHAKRYLDERGRLDLDSEGVLIRASRDILDAITAQRTMQYLSTRPVEPNEHNLHVAAWIVAAAAILLGIGWVAYLFWMRV